MHGFGSFDSAARFCSAFDELRNDLRPRSTMGEPASPDISGDKPSLIGLPLMTGSDASSLLTRENCISAVAHFLGELCVLNSDTTDNIHGLRAILRAPSISQSSGVPGRVPAVSQYSGAPGCAG